MHYFCFKESGLNECKNQIGGKEKVNRRTFFGIPNGNIYNDNNNNNDIIKYLDLTISL